MGSNPTQFLAVLARKHLSKGNSFAEFDHGQAKQKPYHSGHAPVAQNAGSIRRGTAD
jgi:hypothetical protein